MSLLVSSFWSSALLRRFVLEGDEPAGACKVVGVIAPNGQAAVGFGPHADYEGCSHVDLLQRLVRVFFGREIEAAPEGVELLLGEGLRVGGSALWFYDRNWGDDVLPDAYKDRETHLCIDDESDTLGAALPRELVPFAMQEGRRRILAHMERLRAGLVVDRANELAVTYVWHADALNAFGLNQGYPTGACKVSGMITSDRRAVLVYSRSRGRDEPQASHFVHLRHAARTILGITWPDKLESWDELTNQGLGFGGGSVWFYPSTWNPCEFPDDLVDEATRLSIAMRSDSLGGRGLPVDLRPLALADALPPVMGRIAELRSAE